ncbi:MAG: M23 family metallopeptidase [Solobacterium sp.]|nr:M23 family metallopeptidase [Solobacterium sp.]
MAVGTAVDKGDVIGNIGMTGLATGPHVHFFIIENGERRNPCNGFLDCGY